MTDNRFESEQLASDFVITEIEKRAGDVALAREIGPALAKAALVLDEAPKTPNRNVRRLVVGRFVIRDDDLQLIKSVFDGVKAAAASGFFLAAVSVPIAGQIGGAAGVAAAIFLLARQLRAKGTRLDERSLALLSVLRAGGGLTAEAIVEKLNIGRPIEGWTEESVRKGLEWLTKVAVADGTVVALAAQDGKGFWYASGV